MCKTQYDQIMHRQRLEQTIQDAQRELQLDDIANRYAFATGIPREMIELQDQTFLSGRYVATGRISDFPDDIQSAGAVGILKGKWSDFFSAQQLDDCESSMRELIEMRKKRAQAFAD